jgi:hypothetical protein
MSIFSAHLITYEKTRYDSSVLVKQVNQLMVERKGQKVTSHNKDKFSLEEVTLFDVVIHRFMGGIFGFRWMRYMEAATKKGSLRKFSLVRDLLALVRRLSKIPLVVLPKNRLAERVSCLRSLNISASHLEAWRAAYSLGSTFALVLEDDGILTSQSELGRALDFFSEMVEDGQEALINISHSFTFITLRAQHIIQSSKSEPFLETGQVLVDSHTPFTNTLCATLLSREFLKSLILFTEDSLDSKVWRSLAIDFQVNRCLTMKNKERKVMNFHLSPGLIRQGSMRSVAPNRMS